MKVSEETESGNGFGSSVDGWKEVTKSKGVSKRDP